MFEKWQSFRDEALTACTLVHDDEGRPCGAPVKKVFSKVGISFKGDGFYKNDHGSNARARASEKTSENTKSEPSPKESGAATGDSSASAGESSANGAKATKSTKSSASSAA